MELEASCGAEVCEATAQVTYRLPQAGPAVAAASTKLQSKKVTKSLVADQTKTLKLKLGRSATRKLKAAAATQQDRKRIKVLVRASATDSAGNTAEGKLRLKLG